MGWGAAAAAAGNTFNTLAGAYFAKKQQKQAAADQLHLFKRRHQFEVEDLRKAGLNPVLSAHSAGSVGATGIASAPFNADWFGDSMSAYEKTAVIKAEVQQKMADSKTATNTAKASKYYEHEAMGRAEKENYLGAVAYEDALNKKFENVSAGQKADYDGTAQGREDIKWERRVQRRAAGVFKVNLGGGANKTFRGGR